MFATVPLARALDKPAANARTMPLRPTPGPLPNGVHRHYPGQEVGGADWTTEGFGDGGEKQQDGKSVFGVVGAVDGAGFLNDTALA